ncbi:hypothetical protein NP233_g3687 [Leucocoprinus birnbaumii]|uniref:Shieldin complex subunit 2 first OB fold domain-containing protein n=1 Tax=Leucocoprinus birnbaumii TaxID=56174 RepID=A0AAD5VXI1_9AGAR|nr:hypothetical protein NP233_g3687 [Leucocoprinus birnbaumii]
MPTFRVFLGAPSLSDIENNTLDYHWQSISSQRESDAIRDKFPTPTDFPAAEVLDDASRRVSLIYQNVIFNDDEDAEEPDEAPKEIEREIINQRGSGNLCIYKAIRRVRSLPPFSDQTTMITWPPSVAEREQDRSRSGKSLADLTFLNTTTRSFINTQFETQETQETQSLNYSDASSIARFPTFHFNLHALVSITHLAGQKIQGTIKISTLLAVLEVDGPDSIRIKTGKDAGKEVAILRMILGDEDGTICKLTAWRDVAERWGGQQNTVAVRRGDVVLIENVTIAFDSKSSPSITASPFLKSSLTVCYRTMPYAKSDGRLRPDLRLGQGDAAVRKVAAVVAWFQRLAGLDT